MQFNLDYIYGKFINFYYNYIKAISTVTFKRWQHKIILYC